MVMELVGPARATRHAERAATETATEQSLRAGSGSAPANAKPNATAPRRSASASSPKATPRSATPPTSPSASPTAAPAPSTSSKPPSRASSWKQSAHRCASSGCGASRPRHSPTRCRSARGLDELPRRGAPPRPARGRRGAARPPTHVRHARALAAADLAARRGCAVPASAAAHQVSTAHFQAAYPAVAEPGLGSRGVYIGRDIHGGSFVYDPWVLYAAGVLNDANMLVIGRPGHGKSALVKSWMYRSRVFGRTCELIDPKGEYAPLVKALGGQVLTFTPGGTTRLNPLTRLGSREMREGLLEAIARAMLDRPLTQPEALGLAAALAAADRHADGADVCIPDVTAQLRDPGQERRRPARLHRARRRRRSCANARSRCSASPTARCRGMFDQPTQASEQVWDAPAVCLDLSQVGVGQAQIATSRSRS